MGGADLFLPGSVGQPKKSTSGWELWLGRAGGLLRQDGWIAGFPRAQAKLDLPGTYSFKGIPSYTCGLTWGD